MPKKNHSAIINHGKKACINIVRTCGCKKKQQNKNTNNVLQHQYLVKCPYYLIELSQYIHK